MRKLLVMVVSCAAAALLFAPVAVAQQNPYCPEGGYPSSPQQGGGELLCFQTQEQAEAYNRSGEVPARAENPSTGEQVAPDTPDTGADRGAEQQDGGNQEQYTGGGSDNTGGSPGGVDDGGLPETGGPILSLLAVGGGVLLVAGGLFLRRRMS